jgi:hypothetical protein
MVISNNQRAFAEGLEIVVPDFLAIEALIEKIEDSLGQNTMLEQSRWFVMSVLCHSNRCAWDSIDDSEIDKEKQYEIAGNYIATDDFKQSLRTVLKEDRCKFTLLRFAKSRNLEKRTLSTTTKAFKHAQSLLKGLGLINPTKTKARKTLEDQKDQKIKKAETKSDSKPKAGQDKDLLVHRRAARRGYFEDDFLNFLNPLQESEKQTNFSGQMSDQEFEELDAKIDISAESSFVNWPSAQSEDRTSLLVGLAAGGVMFAVMIWLFI